MGTRETEDPTLTILFEALVESLKKKNSSGTLG